MWLGKSCLLSPTSPDVSGTKGRFSKAAGMTQATEQIWLGCFFLCGGHQWSHCHDCGVDRLKGVGAMVGGQEGDSINPINLLLWLPYICLQREAEAITWLSAHDGRFGRWKGEEGGKRQP